MRRTMIALALPAALAALTLTTGCCTVDLSDTSYPETRMAIPIGPGARQQELHRIVRLEHTHYTGEHVAFGLFPGCPCILQNYDSHVTAGFFCVILGPIVNAVSLAMPTVCTLFVEPFTMTIEKRGARSDAISLGLLGAYRWRDQPRDELVALGHDDVAEDGGYRPDLSRIKVTKSPDGTKLWHAYPGYRALLEDVVRDGAVDVLFANGREVRRFRMSGRDDKSLTFTDREVGEGRDATDSK